MGFDLNLLDKKGSTPLHWAPFLSSENAINFLSSWNVDLDIKDFDSGLTPLHLAAITGNAILILIKILRKF